MNLCENRRGTYGILDIYVSYEFANAMYHDRVWSFVS